MLLFLIRHGQTTANETGTYSGQTDVMLTELGKAQAEAIRPVLAQYKFDRVYSSPLSRAVHTAELIMEAREEEDRKERMEKMKKSIRYTAVLGCKYWVIHPIMPFGVCEKDTEDAQKTWDMNIEFMSELLKVAKEVGVTICFENMPMLQFSLAKPDKI